MNAASIRFNNMDVIGTSGNIWQLGICFIVIQVLNLHSIVYFVCGAGNCLGLLMRIYRLKSYRLCRSQPNGHINTTDADRQRNDRNQSESLISAHDQHDTNSSDARAHTEDDYKGNDHMHGDQRTIVHVSETVIDSSNNDNNNNNNNNNNNYNNISMQNNNMYMLSSNNIGNFGTNYSNMMSMNDNINYTYNDYNIRSYSGDNNYDNNIYNNNDNTNVYDASIDEKMNVDVQAPMEVPSKSLTSNSTKLMHMLNIFENGASTDTDMHIVAHNSQSINNTISHGNHENENVQAPSCVATHGSDGNESITAGGSVSRHGSANITSTLDGVTRTFCSDLDETATGNLSANIQPEYSGDPSIDTTSEPLTQDEKQDETSTKTQEDNTENE